MGTVAAFGLSLALGLAFLPLVRRYSLRTGMVARPREDRWHRRPTALLGGVGIFAAFSLGLLIIAWLTGSWSSLPWGLLLGSTIVFLLGLYDDLHHISPPAKLVGQIVAAAVVVLFGYTTAFFTPRMADSLAAQIPNILLTFLWLVGISNAINLLDNMDGLAGGISLITAILLTFLLWDSGSLSLAYVSLALAGAVLAFLVFNFPPASIFMGDSGSLFLGFILAALAIARQPQASNVFAVLGVPTLLFMLPILDTTLVTFTRILRGQSPVQGGRDHTSHRLIAFGLTERQAVLVLYAVALFSGVMGAILESVQYWFSLVLVPILVVILALLTAYLGGMKVVVPSNASGREKTITRIMLQLTFRQRILEVVLDFFLIGIAYYLAFLARFGLAMGTIGLELFLQSLPIALGGTYLSFFAFGVYRGVWRYTGINELVGYFLAVLGSLALSAAGIWLVYDMQTYGPLLFALFGIFLFLGLAASRSSFRVLDGIAQRRVRPQEARVLICGAGDAGEMALRWIQMNPELAFRPVGFLDGDPLKAGRQIHGVGVLGGMDQLEDMLDRLDVEGVILTPELAVHNGHWPEEVVAACRRRGCWVRNLRLEFELLEE